MQTFNKRVFTYKQFCQVTDLMMFSVIRKKRVLKLISKEFQNHIMLAVTEVNGCQACTWFHTKNAVRMKLDKEDISALLSGTVEKLPEKEHIALLFAQHYADTFGKYDPDSFQSVKEKYGTDIAEGILANIRMIMFGNVSGIAFGSLKERVNGKKVINSKLKDELLNFFGVIWLMPFYMIKNIMKKRQ